MSQSKEVHLYIDDDGRIEFVHDDEVAQALTGIGQMDSVRATHVEPTLSSRIKKRGLLQWEIDLQPTIRCEAASIGPYDSRVEALAAEVAWLELRFTHGVGMMTKNALGKTVELKNQGWTSLGTVGGPDVIGSTVVMSDPSGKLHKVIGSGEVVPLVDGEKWHPTQQKQAADR